MNSQNATAYRAFAPAASKVRRVGVGGRGPAATGTAYGRCSGPSEASDDGRLGSFSDVCNIDRSAGCEAIRDRSGGADSLDRSDRPVQVCPRRRERSPAAAVRQRARVGGQASTGPNDRPRPTSSRDRQRCRRANATARGAYRANKFVPDDKRWSGHAVTVWVGSGRDRQSDSRSRGCRSRISSVRQFAGSPQRAFIAANAVFPADGSIATPLVTLSLLGRIPFFDFSIRRTFLQRTLPYMTVISALVAYPSLSVPCNQLRAASARTPRA